jgi:hypothetical protein
MPVGSVGLVMVVSVVLELDVDPLPFFVPVVHELVVVGGGVYELHQLGEPVVPDGLLEVVVEVVVLVGPMPPVPPDVVVVPVPPLPVPDWSQPVPVPASARC